MRPSSALFVAVAALCLPAAAAYGAKCLPNVQNEFVFKIDQFTGEWGAYTVEGCDGPSPTLHIKRGVEYTLKQVDQSNWMHPLGLAYYPDGAHGFDGHAEVPELEYPTPEDCASKEFSCDPGSKIKQAPLYGIDGAYETYSDWNNGVTSGLDVYEPLFQRPVDQWIESGGKEMYGVKITIPSDSSTSQFFYFCHIHSGMSGEIMVDDSVVVGDDNVTTAMKEATNTLTMAFDLDEYYKTDLETSFDKKCGTFGAGAFGEDKDMYCPGQSFLCATKGDSFSKCMEAIDCKMNYEMRVEEHDSNRLAVFMHQMIPHHVNAVQMARIALKLATTSEGFEEEGVAELLQGIIATQNAQIQEMNTWLDTFAGKEAVVCDPPDLTKTRALLGIM